MRSKWPSILRIVVLFVFIPLLFKVMPVSAASPSITGTTPIDGAVDVPIDVSVTAYVYLPNVGYGVDDTTLSSDTVFLYRTIDGPTVKIPVSSLNSTGGGDGITLTPVSPLDPFTEYTFEVTGGLSDTSGEPFLPYSMSFTTGDSETPPPSSISFTKNTSLGVANNFYTSLEISPDHRLYASTITGSIYHWAIQPDGTLSDEQVIDALPGRAIIGLEFDPASTPTNPIIWVSHNHGNIDASNDKHFTGAIAKVTVTGYGTGSPVWTAQDYVVGLPRSIRDHMVNSLEFGPDGGLYTIVGSISAMGDRDSAWGREPETLLSAAVLRLDISRLDALSSLPLDVTTGVPEADGDLLDENNYGLGDPALASFYDPQAPNAPVTLYATGIRNAYDMAWHTNGELYIPANGSNQGGNAPETPDPLPEACKYRIDDILFGDYTSPTVPAATSISTQHDYLYRVEAGGYYGHPNPTRCEWVLNGANPTAGPDPEQVGNHYPEGTLADRNYRGASYDFDVNKSPNGVIEYRSNTFGGALRGKLLVVRYSQNDDIIVLEPGGPAEDITAEQTGITGFGGFSNPLDLIEDRITGNIYVSEAGTFRITLLTPDETGTPEIDLNPSELVYSQVAGDGPGAPKAVTIHNVGLADLNINGIVLSGVNADQFQITSVPALPFLLNPAQAVSVDIVFNPTSTGVKNARLQVQSNDPVNSTAQVNLQGLGTQGDGGSDEPSLQWVMDTYNIPANVGDDDPTTTTINSTTPTAPILGEEEAAQVFQKAGPGVVTVQPIAAYAVNSNPVTMVGWYSAGNPGSKHEVFRILGDSDQTLNPAYSGSSTFDPGTAPFGFYSIWPPFGNREVFTEDALNASWAGSNLHHVRVYPYKYPDGTVVPNAYVLGFEEYTSGWDFNDVVFIVWNVEPAAGQIDFENRDWVTLNSLNYPGMDWVNTWLTFSRINSGVTDHRLHDTVTLRIHNRSQTNPLTVDSLVMSNPAEYSLPNGEDALPELVIPPGSYHDLLVQFIASGGSKGTRIQTLTITSNDPDDPVSVINLGGSYMSAPEGGYEVHIGHIADAFGYSTTVMPIPQGQWAPAGEEVLSVNWNRLNASQPIYVRQLAAFHSCCGGGANLSISNGGGSMNHAPLDGQSLLPLANNAADSSPAEMFSNPGDGFSVTIDGRTSCGSDCGNNHGVRFWPVRGPSGVVVPGVYLVSMDYVGGGGSTNYDYNDNTYLFTNIEPADTQTDLELFASDTPDPVEWQNNVTYTFSVYNNSFFTASNTTLTINLPTAMTPVSVTPDQGSCTPGTPIVCMLGDVNGEQTVDVTIVVTADSPGTKTATAQVTTDAAESDLADNNVTLTTQVDVSQPATITIIKEATPEGPDVFDFTGDLGSFQLVDDGSVVPNPFSAQYNFQDSLTVMAAGYTPDNGSAYAAKPNGETYGWYRLSDSQPVDATGNARDRGGATAPELRTLMHMQYVGGNGVEGDLGWEHALPNGSYEVTVSVGDASYTDSTHTVRVEGVTAINGFTPSASNLFAQGTVTVDVTDGNLTLDPVGGTNTKINYVSINEIPSPSNAKTFTNLAPDSYSVSEIVPAGWTIDGISCTSANFSQFGNMLVVTVAPDEVVTCTFSNSSGGTNTPPTAVDDSANTSEDTPVTFNILTNDNDVDGSLDLATVDLDPATDGQQTQMVIGGEGTFDYNPAAGEVTFTPEPAFFGVSSIQYTVSDNNSAASNAATISVNVAQNAVCPVLYRINSGGPAYAAADGTSPDWMQDQKNAPSPYTTLDSSTYTTSTTIDMSDPSLPASVPMEVFQSERWDGSSPPPMGYAFPVTAGEQYEVRLYFAELYFANPGDRVFAVSIEGNVVLPNYDAVVDAGANFTGVMQSFNITAGDDTLDISFGHVTENPAVKGVEIISICNAGNEPTPQNDTYNASQSGTLNVAAPGVLDNDTHPLNDTMTVISNTQPAYAASPVTVNADGSFTYTHNGSTSLSDSFSYTVQDSNGKTAIATVTIMITATNQAPNAEDDTATTLDGTLVAIDILGNDADPDGDALDPASVAVDTAGLPSGHTVNVLPDGSVEYTPAAGDTGDFSFTYTVADTLGNVSDAATVTVTVTANNDPIAVDDAYTVGQGQTLSEPAPGVLDNDSDPDGHTLTVDSFTQPANGTVTVNADGSFDYTHNGSATTTDSFTYTVIDGHSGTATASVNLTVTAPSNQDPVAVDDNYALNQGEILDILAPGVLDNDSDPDTDPLVVDSYTQPTSGTLVVNGDGSFSYTHDNSATTTDSFTYTIIDGNGGSASASVVITINQSAPVCGVSYRLNVGGPQIAAADGSTPAWSEDQSALLAQGAATLGVPSPYLVDDTPAYGVSGLIDTSDASLPASIPMAVFQRERYDFSSGNPLTYRFPVTAGEQYEVRLFFAELYWTSTGSRVFDIYIEGALVLDNYDTVADAGSNARGVMQTFTVTPADAELEIYFTHEADNPALKGIEIAHLCAPNTAPNAADDAATVNQGGTIATLDGGAASVLANDNDPDGDNLTVTTTPASPPAVGSLTLNADGTFSYTHDGSATLVDSFDYEVCDDGSPSLCATATVSIMVNLLNTPPNAVDDTATVTEGGTITLLDGDVASVLDNDNDPDGNNLTVTTTPVTPPANGTLTLNADGTFSYTQDGTPAATDSFEYEVCDDGTPSQCATATVSITINPVNDPPNAVDDTATVDEGAAITLLDGGAATVLDNDNDPEGDNLTVTTTPVTPPANGTLALNGDGTFSYTHDGSETLTDSFIYEVCDDGTPSQCATATVTITINALNDDPMAVDDNYSTEPGQTLNVAAPGVLDNDSDPEGDLLTVTNFTQPANGTVTVNGDGSFDYSHDNSATTADSFTYTVEDGNQGSATATVNIAINALGNTLPVAENDMYATNQGQTLTVTAPGVMDNDTDADGDTLTVETYTQPTNGTVTVNADGSFDYIHDDSATTSDSFTYMVNDGNGGTDEATVAIYVNMSGNTLPEANDDTYVVDEGNVLVVNVPGVLGNDTDVDDDTLTVVDNTEPALGTLSLLPDGSFEYSYTGGAGATDDLNQAQATVATDSFVYTVSDGNGGTNSASVEIIIRSSDESPDPDDDGGQPVANLADPAISKLGELQSGDLGLPGEQITWIIAISNPSTVNMTNVVVTDEIVPELRIDSAETDRGTVSISGQVVTFQIPFLNTGESIQMRIATTVLQSPESGEFTNLASVRSDQNTIKTATATVNGVTGLPDTGYRPQVEDSTTAQAKSVTEKQGLPIWPIVAALSMLLLVVSGFFLRWRRV